MIAFLHNAVAEGGDRETEKLYALQVAMLSAGLAHAHIPLNGGSEDRRHQREYWKEFAAMHHIPISVDGCSVVLGRKR